MAFKLVFLVLPALALARIDVDLSGTFEGDNSNLKVSFAGNDVGIISETEKATFNVQDNSLKNAVRDYFGKRPDDAYLHSNTPWGDLYKTYGWRQVQRTLVPKNGRLLKITSQPTIVLQQIFENNSSKPATFNVGISQSVEETVSSSWSTGGSLSVGTEISYGFDIEVFKASQKFTFGYTASWGKNTQKSKTVTVGASSAMEITLAPGQAVVAQLQATRGIIQIEMEYEASLSGQTAINYSTPYKGHHFWGLDIGAVMSSGKLSNNKVSREVIDIGFYSDSRVVVTDKYHGNIIMAY